MSPIFTILALSGICVSIAISNYAFSYAQKTFAAIIPTIKILSPYKGQKVPTAENLVVSGTSSYDRSKDCRVSVLLNGIRPYQNTTATGNYGVR
ncbi:MAG: hypothetical protein WCA39_05375, partial [Nitrososphaeraceae archaeon]